MPTTIDLDTLPVSKDYRQPLDAEPGTSVGDYGRAAAAGAYGVLGSAAAGADYVLDTDDDSGLKRTRKFADEGAKAQVEAMTPAARDALNAGFLPGGDKSIWASDVSIANSLGLKLANASPSLLASIIPGGLVAGVARGALSAGAAAAAAAGTATSGAVNASMMAGQVYDDIEKSIMDAKEDYLRSNSGVYRQLRDDGYSDTVARKVLVEAAAGNKPLLAGAVGAIAEQFGASALAARRAVGEAGEGILKGAKKGLVEEGVTEAGQNAMQEGLTQQGQNDAGTMHGFDWRKILEQTVQGGVVGGLLGGAVGGVTGIGGREATSAAGEDRVPETAPAEPARAPVIDAATAAAAGDTTGSRARASLDNVDAAIGELDKLRQPPVDPAIAAAVKSDDVPRNTSDFVPQDEFEVDPDAEPGQPASAPVAEPTATEPQQAAQAAPEAAPEPQPAPATAPEPEAAVAPPQATEAATAKPQVASTIDLDNLEPSTLPPVPDEPRPPILDRIEAGPRVLRPVNEAPQPTTPREDKRISRTEVQRIAKGEGDAIALSTNPADWTKQSDRARVKKLAEATIKAKGDEAPQWARDVVDALGQRRTGQGPAAKAAREKYAAARQALHDSTQARVQEGVARRETDNEARDRRAQEKRIADGHTAAQLVRDNPMPSLALRGAPKAVRAYAADLVAKARAAGVGTAGATDDAHLVHLKTAAEVAQAGSTQDQIQQFITDDFLLRHGAGEEIRTNRKVNQDALKRGPSYDETPRASQDVREGADGSEAYEAEGAVIEPASETSEPGSNGGEQVLLAEPAPAPAREPAAEVVPGTTGVVGQNRAGQFQKVESRAAARARQVAERKAAAKAQPTQAQKEAGNYPMGHTRALGFDVSVENAKGSTRSGTDADGREWSVKMPADYGYLRGTKGVDGDHVDVYLGPKAGEDGPVYVVNQNNLDGSFDEHKAMVGFRSLEEARRTYKAGFSDGKGAQRIGSIVEMSPDQFRDWAKAGPKGPAVVPGTTSSAPTKPQSKAAATRAAIAKSKADLAEFFKPGEDVPSYGGGRDRVIAFDPDQRTVRVQAVNDQGEPMGRERTHSTMPSPKEIARTLAARQTVPALMPLRAKRAELDADAEANAREIASLLGDEPEIQGTGEMLVSPRTGAQTPILSSGRLGDYLGQLDNASAGGVAGQINPFIARRLKQIIPDVPVHVVSKDGMRALVEDIAGKGGFPNEVMGYYDPATHQIVLREDDISEAALSHLMIHEGLHAAFMQTIERNPAAKRMIRGLMDEVRDHLGPSASEHYGMTNEHEFVSEAMSSRSFQDLLATVPSSRAYSQLPLNNVWAHFISGVRKFLGLKPVQPTALDAALRIGAVLTDLRNATNQPSTPRTVNAMPAALGAQAVREGLSDTRGAARGFVTAKVLRVRTMDQLRQAHSNLFPAGEGKSHLDNLVKKVQRWQNYVTDKRRAADVHVQDYENLRRSNPKVAQEFAILANDVTMANLNLLKGTPTQEQMQAANRHVYGQDPKKSDIAAAWQSKAQHADLQRRFSALPEAQQDQFLRAARYYRETQNEKARAFAEGILDQLAPEITGQARADLVTKTLAGRLGDEDKELLKNNTLFDALKSAPEFKSIKGMYFPLMRQGDYVVRTRDVIADTMGGTEVEPGVVEFSGTEKQARKAADAFARKTDLSVTRIAKRYYDAKTGEPIKAADADTDSRVAYRVSVQTKGLHMFDSRTQAERFIREARRDGTFHAVEDWQHREGMEQRGDLSYSQLSTLVRSVEARDDLTPGQRQILKTVVGQAATRMMSGNRIQHRSLPRNLVQGAGENFSRNMLGYATAESNFLGKLNYMPGIRSDLQAMEDQAKAFANDKSQIRKMVYDEIENRVNANDVGLNQPSAFVRDLFAVIMLGKLASPAHSIINAAQPLMTTLPVLGGDHGNVTAAAELTRAMRDIGAWRTYGEGVANTYTAARRWGDTALDTTDVVGAVRRRLSGAKDGAELGRMLEDVQERGALGDSAAFELASAIAGGRGVAGTALAKADRVFRQAPAAVEAVNRAGTAVAAYRLARRKGKTEEQARDYAFDTVQKTQFDYSAFNAPPSFSNPVLRPFLQFKKYGQAMTDLYASMIYQAFKGESKADRRVAMKQFGNLVAVHALMAGSFGIPGLELIKVGFVLSAALGLGGAGWGDQERRIRRALEESIGKSWSDLVTDGAVGRALGVDLSGRLSAADLWTFGEPRKYKTSEISQWVAEQYFGASGGTVRDWREGVLAAQDADYLKAAQKILPVKVLGDTAKALNGYLDEKMSLGEAGIQALGFKPTRIADQQQAKGDIIAERAKVKDKRDELRNKYLNAGSAGSRAKVKVLITEYNRTADKRMKLSIPGLDRMRDNDARQGFR
ncbi:PLxRFG domain-containing protein [Methylobacterium fujisawaense]